MNTPIHGARYMLRGFRLIAQPGVRRYVLIPLALNVVIFALLITLGAQQFGSFVDWLIAWLPGWLHWLWYVLWPLFALFALLVMFFTFSLIANLIGSPFNGMLAEAVERRLTGKALPDQSGGWGQMAKDVLPALLGELRKLLYFIGWAVPLGLLFLIPVVNLAAPFLWLAFGAWMLAFEYADFPMGNHGLKFGEQRKRLREKQMMSLGFGGAAMFATLVPFVNFIVMPAAVAGATAMWVEEFAPRAGEE